MLAWLALRGSVLSYPRCLAFSVSLSQVLHNVGLVGSAPLTVQLPAMDVGLGLFETRRQALPADPQAPHPPFPLLEAFASLLSGV